MEAERWHRAAEVFEAALDRPEAEQQAYVLEACGGDADLRREVEALIEEERRAFMLDAPLSPDAIAGLTSIERVGPYRIESLLGVGGMGEVYRARDTRLGREVAIKVLPAAFAEHGERLARFKREAQMLASLNHPHIAALYEFESEGAVEALVLELVEGPTLAERLAHGPLPLADALAIARQIADALAYAHEAGVVHRDLKPANVKVRDDGVVKVLDFGLAKMRERSPAEPAAAKAAPTITTPAMTAAGIILGTAAYMSPEQARGKPADRRSDIWAFGCVLYEMLTGRRAFAGDDVSDTLAAILRADPDWSALPPSAPAGVRRVLHRALEKDPGRRYHDIADVRLDLEEAAVSAEAVVADPGRQSRVRERITAGLAIAGLAGGLVYVATQTPPLRESPVVRFEVAPPESGFFGTLGGFANGVSGATISPDGTRMAFSATDRSGRTSLWIRPIDTNASRAIADTDGGAMPFWSPDGHALGFFADGKVKIVDFAGGGVRVIADATGGRGASWGNRDVIVFSRGVPAELVRVSPAGGDVTRIATGDIRQPLWPSFLPDGRHFVFYGRLLGVVGGRLTLASIDPGFTPRPLVPSDTGGVVLSAGFLLFTQGGRLLQQPFDLARLEVSGEAVPVNEPVLINEDQANADFAVSAGGALVYQAGTRAINQFTWVDRAGHPLGTVGERGNYRAFALSPDGNFLAYEDQSRGDIWLFDLERRTPSRFTSAPGMERSPAWFPDGTRIAYRRDDVVFEKDATGTTPERRLLDMFINGPTQITADGKWLVYFWVRPDMPAHDVGVLPLSGDRTPRPVLQSAFAEVEPMISPDGRWIAYASTETGQNEVYVQPFPPTGPRWRVSRAGGRQPMWRADGKELYFVADDRRFYAATVRPGGPVFDHDDARFLFEMHADVFNIRNSYLPSPDGQRFLVNQVVDDRASVLNVALNWKPR